MKIIGHRNGQSCPLCGNDAFCDDCGLCEGCGFAPPVVTLVQPPAPAPAIACLECGGTVLHTRTCSTTLRAAMH